MKWPRNATIVMVICALAGFLTLAPARAAELVPLYTPPAGGTAYVLGAGVVSVTNRYVTDAGMVHVKKLKGLRWLMLTGTQVTGAGLFHVKEYALF